MDNNVFDNQEPLATGPLSFSDAYELLGKCTRNELRDHYFHDREVFWTLAGEEVADGHFSSEGHSGIYINSQFGGTSFHDEEARKLVTRGIQGVISRNDTTGPDTYTGG